MPRQLASLSLAASLLLPVGCATVTTFGRASAESLVISVRSVVAVARGEQAERSEQEAGSGGPTACNPLHHLQLHRFGGWYQRSAPSRGDSATGDPENRYLFAACSACAISASSGSCRRPLLTSKWPACRSTGPP